MRLTLLSCALCIGLGVQTFADEYYTHLTSRTATETEVTFAGPPDGAMLEASTNLNAGWQPVVSVSRLDGGFPWREPNATNGARFYRSRSIEPSDIKDADDFHLIDHTGKSGRLFYNQPNTNLTAFVLIFAHGNYSAFSAKINAIKNTPRFQNKLLIYTIESNTNVTRSAISNQVVSTGITWPVMHDPTQLVTRAYDANFIGEVFVISRANLKVVYRGMIDSGTNTFLINALDRLGVPTQNLITRVEPRQNPVTRLGRTTADYSTVIAPLLQRKCVTCHSPDNIAPFALTKYDDIPDHAPHMKEMVMTGMMPPFHADPQFGKWQNDVSMTGLEKAQLIDWIDAGMPRGTGPDVLTNLPPIPPKWPVELGPPDEIVTIPTQSVMASGTEPYRYIFANATNSTPRWLRAAVVRPSNPSVVHHYIVWPGHNAQLMVSGLAFYVPGHNDRPFPANTGIQIPANAPLTFNLHYTAHGEAATDKPELALWYTNTPPTRTLQMAAPTPFFFLGPGSVDQDVSSSHTFNVPATIYAFSPHMHLRGQRMRFELSLPGVAGRQMLLSVPNYHFDWQRMYVLDQPLDVPAGAVVHITGAFDNSYLNPHNPDPTAFVSWGEQSWEEMFIGYIEYANR